MSTPANSTTSSTTSRHSAGLFDIRNIIGLLMLLYGLVLLVMSFTVSAADRAKANGVNLNLWTGLGLLATGVVLVGWARLRPIIVDEAQLEREKAVSEEMSNPNLHH